MIFGYRMWVLVTGCCRVNATHYHYPQCWLGLESTRRSRNHLCAAFPGTTLLPSTELPLSVFNCQHLPGASTTAKGHVTSAYPSARFGNTYALRGRGDIQDRFYTPKFVERPCTLEVHQHPLHHESTHTVSNEIDFIVAFEQTNVFKLVQRSGSSPLNSREVRPERGVSYCSAETLKLPNASSPAMRLGHDTPERCVHVSAGSPNTHEQIR